MHWENICFANGKSIISTHIGDVNGYIINSKITFHNVFLIPEFNKSLISINKENIKLFSILTIINQLQLLLILKERRFQILYWIAI